MKTHIHKIHGADHKDIHTYQWMPDAECKGIFIIVHGALEHAGRYIHFAEFLTSKGFGVFAQDHRGHGITGKEAKSFSFFAEEHGWKYLVDDLRRLHLKVKSEYPNLPIFLFGHSMGSFIARDYVGNCSGDFNGLILSGGTIGKPGLARVAGALATLLSKIFGQNTQSKMIHNSVFGDMNRKIKGYKTEADYLSTDEKEVEKFLNDELCNHTVTYNFAIEFAGGSLECNKEKTYRNTPNSLPILLISGLQDPVGGHKCDEVLQLAEAFKNHGSKNVEVKLYEGARHELLNEKNKREVMEDILYWVNENG